MTELTRKVVEYQRTGAGLERLVQEISQRVYRFPQGQNGFDQEDGAEFLLRFLPRITGLIRRYRETGQSFDSYLGATLRWQIKSYAAARAKSHLQSFALGGPGSELRIEERERATRSGTEAHERVCSSLSRGAAYSLSAGQRHRVIYLALKLSERLQEQDYRRVARAAGCDEEWLIGCWQALRARCASQRGRREKTTIQRDQAWFQVRCLQYRLRLTLEDTERAALSSRLTMWRRRHESALLRLRRMYNGPTHAEIADVVGVPKGTVDSGVFYAKHEVRDPEKLERLAAAVGNS